MDEYQHFQTVREGAQGKKLTDAGRYWAAGANTSNPNKADDLAADMDAMQLSDEFQAAALEHIKAQARRDQGNDFIVWRENWPAVELFSRCRTQWRLGPHGGVLGLDYAGVIPLVNLAHPKTAQRLFAEIQLIESGALAELEKNHHGR